MTPAATPTLRTRRLSHVFGVEIQGLDLRERLPDETIAAIRALWNQHGIVLLRGQDISANSTSTKP